MKREEVLQDAVPPEPTPQASAKQIDKRRHARYPVSVSAEVIEAKTGTRVAGRATDLGVGGCYIDTLNTLPEGTEVEVLLHSEGRTLQLRALVAYIIAGNSIGMGLSFVATSAHQGATLLDWLTGSNSGPRDLAGQTEPDNTSAAPAEITKPDGTREALEELVALLVRKQVLTTSESARIRDRISRTAVQDAP